ncbi:unknown protein [Desulfotalea psychrophila LSv54]|uniref:Uncharacterized protein n=1 Tax=Desulfotalea psychrophila (strain LSv54 / DSM 12343) TaxID=177439 RepID=Q6ARK2_DESPS|nr:unknown protein [Desulfotalea psychrophila LSv54]
MLFVSSKNRRFCFLIPAFFFFSFLYPDASRIAYRLEPYLPGFCSSDASEAGGEQLFYSWRKVVHPLSVFHLPDKC